jgi:hypothetical protein
MAEGSGTGAEERRTIEALYNADAFDGWPKQGGYYHCACGWVGSSLEARPFRPTGVTDGPVSYGCGRCTRNDVIHLVEASIAAPKASLAALQERLEEVTKERERLAAEIRAKVTWGADLLTERDSLAEALKAIEALPRTRPMTEGAHELVSVQEAKDIARAALQKPEQSVEGR